MGQSVTQIVVTRRQVDGWFVYKCEQLPGLFVANQDDRVAYEGLPEMIRLLIQLDEGVECVVSHAVPYAEFMVRAKLKARAEEELQRRTDELIHENDAEFTFVLQAERSLLLPQ